jgi:hypothetical protein
MLASRGVAEKQPVSLRTKRGRRAPARLVGTNGGTHVRETQIRAGFSPIWPLPFWPPARRFRNPRALWTAHVSL